MGHLSCEVNRNEYLFNLSLYGYCVVRFLNRFWMVIRSLNVSLVWSTLLDKSSNMGDHNVRFSKNIILAGKKVVKGVHVTLVNNIVE